MIRIIRTPSVYPVLQRCKLKMRSLKKYTRTPSRSVVTIWRNLTSKQALRPVKLAMSAQDLKHPHTVFSRKSRAHSSEVVSDIRWELETCVLVSKEKERTAAELSFCAFKKEQECLDTRESLGFGKRGNLLAINEYSIQMHCIQNWLATKSNKIQR
jgi:hypothetical protein